MGYLSPYGSETQLEAPLFPCVLMHRVPEILVTPSTSKKRCSLNAFILFRSHVITNKLYPSEMKHQNNISRFVVDMQRSASASERALFLRNAEEEKILYEIKGSVEMQKKKRTRKLWPAKRYEMVPQPDVPFSLTQIPASPSTYASSPSSSEDNASPVPVLCTLTLNLYTPPRKESASPLRAPQSMPIHSLSLLGWDIQADSHGPYSEECAFLSPGWLSSSRASSLPPASSGVFHNDVAAFDKTLQLELDFLLSSYMTMSMPTDAYPDRASPVFHIPSSKPLPYPFGAYDIPLAPF